MRSSGGGGECVYGSIFGRVCPFCYTLRAGRAYGPQGQRLQGLGNLGPFLFAPIAGPQQQNHSHRARPWARPWANRPKLGVLIFYLTLGCHPIAGPGHRAKGHRSRSPVTGQGHRSKAGRPKIRGPYFRTYFWGSLSQS